MLKIGSGKSRIFSLMALPRVLVALTAGDQPIITRHNMGAYYFPSNYWLSP